MAGVNYPIAIVTEKEILQMLTFLECAVLSPSLLMLIRLFSLISVNSGFYNFSYMPGMSVKILSLFTSVLGNNCDYCRAVAIVRLGGQMPPLIFESGYGPAYN